MSFPSLCRLSIGKLVVDADGDILVDFWSLLENPDADKAIADSQLQKRRRTEPVSAISVSLQNEAVLMKYFYFMCAHAAAPHKIDPPTMSNKLVSGLTHAEDVEYNKSGLLDMLQTAEDLFSEFKRRRLPVPMSKQADQAHRHARWSGNDVLDLYPVLAPGPFAKWDDTRKGERFRDWMIENIKSSEYTGVPLERGASAFDEVVPKVWLRPLQSLLHFSADDDPCNRVRITTEENGSKLDKALWLKLEPPRSTVVNWKPAFFQSKRRARAARVVIYMFLAYPLISETRPSKHISGSPSFVAQLKTLVFLNKTYNR